MEDIAARQQELKRVLALLAPLEQLVLSSDLLGPLATEKCLSLRRTVDTALSLYNMFERKHISQPEQTAMGFFGVLPDELVLAVLSYLRQNQLCVTRRVCQRWKRFTEDESLWKAICDEHKFAQPLTRVVRSEWLYRSKQTRLSLFNGVQIGRRESEDGTYEGEFRDDLRREGFGILVGTTRYEGEWRNDRFHGRGECRFLNGAIYVGEFEDGQQHGRGEKRWANGSSYCGLWAIGFPSGYGVFLWQDGERYEGNWEQGMQSGHGRYTWPDGDVYDGEWRRDMLCGQGRHTWHDGCSFEGEWRDGKRVGQGEYRWPDGAGYVGQFEDSKRHGMGCMRWGDGVQWTGLWRDDRRFSADPSTNSSVALTASARPWDMFFHKNYDQQRAYVREIMSALREDRRQLASPS